MNSSKEAAEPLPPVFLSDVEADAAKLLLRKLTDGSGREHGLTPHDAQLYELACNIYSARRERRHFLATSLFAEPAWDMLLSLYCSMARGERLSVSSLCFASATPHTTALRWVNTLEGHGLVERKRHSEDGRVTIIRLSANGRKEMAQYLQRVSEKYFPPRRD